MRRCFTFVCVVRMAAVLFAAALLMLPQAARAQTPTTYTWDPGAAGGTDGNGIWDTSTGNWYATADSQTWANVASTAANNAVFGEGGSSAYTVTLGAPIDVGLMTFQSMGSSGSYMVSTSSSDSLTIYDGITLNSGSGPVTISSTDSSADVLFGAANTWTNNSSSVLTVSSAVAAGAYSLTVGGSGNTTISGGLSGTGALVKSGAGTLTISNNTADNLSGGLFLNGGIYAITSANSLGPTGAGVTFNGGTLFLNWVGGGQGGANFSTSQPITVNAGGGTIDQPQYTNQGNNAYGTVTLSGNISGTGTLTYEATGNPQMLTLSGNNSNFTGNIYSTTGGTPTLTLIGGSAAGNGAIDFSSAFQGNTLNLLSNTNNDTFAAAVTFNNYAQPYINVNQASAGFTNNTLNLTSVSVPLGNGNGLTIGGGNGYSLAIGSLSFGNAFPIIANVPLAIDSMSFNSNNGGEQTMSGSAGGTIGSVVDTFGATRGAIAVLGGTWTFTGANSYGSGPWTANNNYETTGGTEISGASTTLVISQDLALGTAPGTATPNNVGLVSGGTLRANASFTLNANRGIGIGNNTASAGDTGTLDVASGQTLTYNGIIASSGTTGTVNLITTPSGGTLILGGGNTYNGTTTVAGGTLLLNNSTLTTGTARVSVANGATLGGNGTILGAITLNGTASLTPGNAATGTGSLALNSNPLALLSGTTSNFVISSASPGGNTVIGTQITSFGTLTYGGTLNVTAVGTPDYAAGEVYALFPGITSESGTFSAINLPSISADNLKWSGFNYATGSLTILPVGVSYTNPEYTLSIAATATNAHVGAAVSLTTTIVNTGGALTSDSIGYTGLGATLTGGSGGTIGGPTGGTGSGDVAYNVSGFTSGLTYTNSTPGAYSLTASVATTTGDNGTTPSQNGPSGAVTINFYSGISNWNTASSGNWSSYGNWDAGGAPGVYASNPTGDSATFGSQGSGPISVIVDVPVSLTTLTFNSTANSYTLAAGAGSLTLDGSGAAINVTGNHTIAAPVTLVSNTTITTNTGTDSLTISGVIGGNGTGSGATLTTAGPGLVVVSANSTYTGGTTIGGGTLRIGNGGASGTLGTGPITDDGILAFDRSDNTQVISISIGGNGAVNQVGTGMTTLSGSNSYGGGTNINAGILEFPQPANMPATGDVTVAGGSTLAVGAGGANGWTSTQIDAIWNGTGNASWSSGGILGIDSTNATGGTFTYASSITDGNGGTTPMGLAAMGSGKLVLTGTNSFSGGLYLNGGTVSVGSDVNLGAPGGAITFNGGTLAFSTAFNVDPTRPITVNAGGGTIDATGTITLGSNITGAGGINLNNSGVTLILSGNNTFAGGISNPGNGTYYSQTIQLNGASAGGTGTISFGNDFAQQNITLNLRSDTSATFSPTSVVFNQTDDYGGSSTTINVGPLTTATNQVLTLNSVTGPSDGSPGAFTISGSAGYTLGVNTLTMPQTNNATINANANVQVGTLNWTPYASNGVPLILQGTAGGSVGRINSTGGPTMGGIEVAGGTWTLTGANSFGSGPWTSSGNYFAAGGTEVVGSSSVLVISNDLALGTLPGAATPKNIGLLNGGTLRADASFTLNANRGIGIGNNTGSTGDTGTIDVASGQILTYNGVIASSGTTGTVNLVTAPSGGTLILGGANTFTGTTTVAGGTLVLTGTTNALSSGTIVNAGTLRVNGSLTSGNAVTVGGATPGASGTPSVGGTGTINGSLTVSGSGSGLVAGHIAPSGYTSAASPPSAPLNLAGALTLNSGAAGGSELDFNLSNSTSGANDQISIIGSGAVNYGTGGVLNINAYQSGTLAYGTYVLIDDTSSGTLSGGTGWTIGVNSGANPLQGDSIAVVGNNLDLIVSAVSVYWTGANTSWDTNPGNTTSWVNAGGTANTFATGMAVTFGDTYPTSNAPVASSGGNVQVTIQDAGVQPGSTGVTFTNSTLNYIISNATPSDTIGITGTTGLTLNGAKSVTLAGANSFSGPVAVNAGQLILANGAALGTSSGVTLAGGALQLQDNITTSNAIQLTLNGPDVAGGALSNVSGNNTYTGAIMANVPSTIGSTAGTLTLSGAINNGNLLTFTGAGNTTIGTAGISGAGGLTQNGTGVLTLSAANNSYTGPTNVNSGTLRISGGVTATSSFSVGSSGTVGGGGTITSSGAVTLSGIVAPSFAIAPSSGLGAATLAINGNVTLSSGSTLDYYVSGTPDNGTPESFNDHVAVTGNLSLSGGGTVNIVGSPTAGGTYELFTYTGTSSGSTSGWSVTGQPNDTFSLAGGQFDVTIVAGNASEAWISNDSTGSFDISSNWTNGHVPSGAGLTATFDNGGLTKSPITVTVGSSDVVGSLVFNNASPSKSYILSGGNLKLNNNGNGASVNVSNGASPTLSNSMALTLAEPGVNPTTKFNIDSSSSLDVAGTINESPMGQQIVLMGGGTLQLDGGANSYTGGTTVGSGLLILDSGSASATTLGTGPLAINGSTSTVNVNSATASTLSVGSLSGTGGGTLNVGTFSTLAVNQTTTGTFNGTLLLSGGLVLAGASGNTLTISGQPTLASGSSITVNSGTLALTNNVGPANVTGTVTASIASGATLQLAGSANVLSGAVNITTQGSGTSGDGAVSVVGASTQTVGVISGQTVSSSPTIYSGNTTVGDGTKAANLTATQILQNTLTINAGSTVTIAPSGSGISMDAIVPSDSVATSDADSSTATADGDSSSDPFTAIQEAIASGSISAVKGEQLENRIAAIGRLAATDRGFDVSVLEDRVLAALPTPSVWSSSGTSPLIDSGSGLLAIASGTSGSSSGSSLSGATAVFAPAVDFGGSPATVPEPTTFVLSILGGGILIALRRRTICCE